jgi:hypothetical protein
LVILAETKTIYYEKKLLIAGFGIFAGAGKRANVA